MENVAFVDPVGAADAVSQIVATNVHPVVADSFHFVPMTEAGIRVKGSLSEHRAVPTCAEDKLDLLADLRIAAETVAHAKQSFIDSMLSAVSAKLADYDADIEALNGQAAVLAKGRESWDSKLLQGFAIAFPEIEKAKKVGEPSVSIRLVGGAK